MYGQAWLLSISDLADVVAALQGFIQPYQLGIQLRIDTAILKTIEKDYPGDTKRQQAEVIEHWLRNSKKASWIRLANAVDRVGGHARLVETLKGKGTGQESPQQEPRRGTKTLSIHSCKKCNILILGRMGHGKSTLGNKISNSDGNFKLNCEVCPQTCNNLSVITSLTRSKNYLISIYVHHGLFEGASNVGSLSSDIPSSLNLLFFVFKSGHRFVEEETKILEEISRKWKVSQISALVLTHCEHLSEKERREIIENFIKDHPSVAELMGNGILAVGFPDNSHIQPGSQLGQTVEDDKQKLRQLIYSCDEPVHILQPPQNGSSQPPQTEVENSPPPQTECENRQSPQPDTESRQPPQNASGEHPRTEIENRQPPQTASRWSFRCSVL